MSRQVLSTNKSLRNRGDQITLGTSLPSIISVQLASAILRLDTADAMNTQFDDRVRVPSELSVVIMTIEIRTEPLSQEVNGHHGTGHEIATHVAAAVHQGKQPADGVSQTGVKVEDAQSQPQNDGAQRDHYSVFTGAQKRAIIISGSVLTLVSFMGSTMYYPALNQACSQ